MFSALFFGLFVQQASPLDYATTRRHVEYGGNAILYVGVPPKQSREVYGYVATLPGIEPGTYRCYRGPDGKPTMDRVGYVSQSRPVVRLTQQILGGVCVGSA